MIRCQDCENSFRSEHALRTHQGRIHGTVLGKPGHGKKGPRVKRCVCECGVVHRALPQIRGYRRVPMVDPFTGDAVRHPETDDAIMIFDATRSIEPEAYGLRRRPLSGSHSETVGGRIMEVGAFQRDFPPMTRQGVRCACPRCGHLHILGVTW